jgi:hypothetical protein
MDERDGLDESFKGLECTGTLVPFAELAVSGRWSAGDMGGVCEVCVSC